MLAAVDLWTTPYFGMTLGNILDKIDSLLALGDNEERSWNRCVHKTDSLIDFGQWLKLSKWAQETRVSCADGLCLDCVKAAGSAKKGSCRIKHS